MDSAPIVQFDKLIIPKKNYSREFEIKSDKKNKFKISIFNKEDKLKLSALNLTTEDSKAISNEYIKIILDNSTEITEKTDSNGIIILDLDDFSGIEKMEFEFLGDEDYSSSDDYIII